MKILVKVKPGSKTTAVKKIDQFVYEVSVKAPPRDGKANGALIAALADYFGVSQALIEIRSGALTKTKVVIVHIS